MRACSKWAARRSPWMWKSSPSAAAASPRWSRSPRRNLLTSPSTRSASRAPSPAPPWRFDMTDATLAPALREAPGERKAAARDEAAGPRMLIRQAAVLGAGVMGAQIAAHLANANVRPLLFELAAEGKDKNASAQKAIDG